MQQLSTRGRPWSEDGSRNDFRQPLLITVMMKHVHECSQPDARLVDWDKGRLALSKHKDRPRPLSPCSSALPASHRWAEGPEHCRLDRSRQGSRQGCRVRALELPRARSDLRHRCLAKCLQEVCRCHRSLANPRAELARALQPKGQHGRCSPPLWNLRRASVVQ